METVTNTIFLAGDTDRIFDLVTTAKYWPEWHPATVGVSGQIGSPMREGDVIRERAKIGNDIGENDWTVTVWEQNKRVVLEMPGTRLGDLKIAYCFEREGNGVCFTRKLTFEAGGLPPSASEQITRQMESDSALALERIKAMVEQMAPVR